MLNNNSLVLDNGMVVGWFGASHILMMGAHIEGDDYEEALTGCLKHHPFCVVRKACGANAIPLYYEVLGPLGNGSSDCIYMGRKMDYFNIPPQYRLAMILDGVACHIDTFRAVHQRNLELYQ